MRKESYETIILDSIISDKWDMDYNCNQSKAANQFASLCEKVVEPLIEYEIDYDTVSKLKSNCTKKQLQHQIQGDYGVCLLDNIYFELYKYNIITSTMDCMAAYEEELSQMNYETFVKNVIKYCQDNFTNCQEFIEDNPKSRKTLQRYLSMNIADREYAYVLSFLKTNIAIDVMQKILYGRTETNYQITTWYKEFLKIQLFWRDKRCVLDKVISKKADARLSALYKEI